MKAAVLIIGAGLFLAAFASFFFAVGAGLQSYMDGDRKVKP